MKDQLQIPDRISIDKNGYDIFISYAQEDITDVKQFVKALEKYDWIIWYDSKIPPGKNFDQIIYNAIVSAKIVIVFWSNYSVNSEWVKEEANIGKAQKKLIPVFINNVNPPFGFTMIQTVNLVSCPRSSDLFFGNLIS